MTIAGSDSGGGAGIQADLKTFAALGVHGVCAVTAITAQNPSRVLAIEPCSPRIVGRQLDAVFGELPPKAIKTGMLRSHSIIGLVVDFLRGRNSAPLVVDPVMISTSGRRLLESSAMEKLKRDLLPLATLVTPNLGEAEILLGKEMKTLEDLRWAAKEMRRRFGCAAVIKGGHMKGFKEAADIFYDGDTELLLTASRVTGAKLHGTGCAFSAAVTAYLAHGHLLPKAVSLAKQFITQAIANVERASKHDVLRLCKPDVG